MHQSLRGGIVGAPIFEGRYCWCTNLCGEVWLVHQSLRGGIVGALIYYYFADASTICDASMHDSGPCQITRITAVGANTAPIYEPEL